MQVNDNLNSEQGFYIIEALVAVFILGFGIMSLYAMQISSITANSKANAMTRSAAIASEVVEHLSGLGFTNDLLVETANSATVSAAKYQSLISEVGTDGLPLNNVTPYSSNTPLQYPHWSGQDDLYDSDGIDNDNDGSVDEGDEFQSSLAPIDYVKWFVQDYGTDSVDNDGDGDIDETDEQNSIKKISVYVHYQLGNSMDRDNWYHIDFLKVAAAQ